MLVCRPFIGYTMLSGGFPRNGKWKDQIMTSYAVPAACTNPTCRGSSSVRMMGSLLQHHVKYPLPQHNKSLARIWRFEGRHFDRSERQQVTPLLTTCSLTYIFAVPEATSGQDYNPKQRLFLLHVWPHCSDPLTQVFESSYDNAPDVQHTLGGGGGRTQRWHAPFFSWLESWVRFSTAETQNLSRR